MLSILAKFVLTTPSLKTEGEAGEESRGLEGIIAIIHFFENIYKSTIVQLAGKHNNCARMM